MKRLKIVILFCFFISGCSVGYETKWYPVEMANTKAPTAKAFKSAGMEVNYLCKKVFYLALTDFVRSGCIYVVGLQKVKDQVQFHEIKEEAVKELALTPRLTFWEKHGRIFLTVILVVVIGIMIKTGHYWIPIPY